MQGSLFNRLNEQAKQPIPEIGMGCTIMGYTDRYAATIVKVSENKREIGVQRDNAIRTDSNGMSESQTYRYEPNTEMPIEYFTLRKNGRWVKFRQPLRGGQGIAIGYRDEYYDYSF